MSRRTAAAVACSGFAAGRPAGRRYPSTAAAPGAYSNGAAAAKADSVTFTAAEAGWTHTCYNKCVFSLLWRL